MNRLDFILSQSEGQFAEFKRSVSKSIDRELVAFANSGGGNVIIGVSNDGHIVGIANINTQISRVESIARNCDPAVPIKITPYKKDGKSILVVEVASGGDKPFACSSGFYLRSGASAQKMTRDEIIEFLYSSGQVKWDEKICEDFLYPRDFDKEAFRYFLDMAGISSAGMTAENLLINIAVAKRQGKRLKFNNAGVLFFAKDPARFLKHAVVDCMLLSGMEKVDILDRKELKANIMENVKQAMIFLESHLPLRYEIKNLKRKEFLEIPKEALREAVLNAVIHRDYHFDGAWITVEIYGGDRVEISDPGGLPPGMALDDLGKKSVHRNQIIAELFHRMGEVEKAGSGINRIKKALSEANLPEPQFLINSFYTIQFKRPGENVGINVGVKFGVKFGVKGDRRERMVSILLGLYGGQPFNTPNLSEKFDIGTRTIEKDLSFLKSNNLIFFEGAAKTGKYTLTDKARKLIEEWKRG